jgi:hypothetical protein
MATKFNGNPHGAQSQRHHSAGAATVLTRVRHFIWSPFEKNALSYQASLFGMAMGHGPWWTCFHWRSKVQYFLKDSASDTAYQVA